jgi:Methyltransferase domain
LSSVEEPRSAPGVELDLGKYGDYYIAEGSRPPSGFPKILYLDGRHWFRFMDRAYASKAIHALEPSEVRDLCELRLDLGYLMIDEDFHLGAVRNVLLAARRWTSSPSRILDFGVGDGRCLARYGETYPEANICGCDISLKALTACPSGFPVFRVAAEGPLPLSGQSFDLIIAVFVFHFSVPVSMISELRRVSGGILVGTIYGPLKRSLPAKMSRVGFSLLEFGPMVGLSGHYYFIARPESCPTSTSLEYGTEAGSAL